MITTFMKKLIKTKFFASVMVVGAVFGLAGMGSVPAYADAAISLTVDTSTLSFDLLPTSASGTFAKSGNANISVSTNSPTGYELSIKASSTDTNARNLVNGNEVIRSFNSLTTPETAVTEANFKALANTKYNGMWGFLPSKYNSSANADFIVAPDSNGILLDSTNTANPDTANNYTLAIGARVDSTTKLGLYSNTYVITAVANGTAYSFIYNDNVVSNMPNDKMSMTTATSENLASNTPERDGYEFIGWCLGTASSSNITTTDGVDTCSSTVYQPSASVAIASGASNDKYLYAMWQVATPPAPGSCTDEATCMQTSTACDTTLTDARDGSTYTVATINGKCWMTQNLRITGTIAAEYSNFSGNDFNVSAGSLTSGNSYTEARTAYSNNTGYGAYYNYCAASAGTVCNDTTKADATVDICPAGWALPTQAQFNGLPTNESHFTASSGLAGYYYGGSLSNAGVGGSWWSATAYNATNQYILNYYSGSDYWNVDNRLKYNGYSIRCVRSS